MNWRIKILTVALLGLFALGCFLYVRFYVSPKAHGIILFIAPATDLNLLAELKQSTLKHSAPTASLITDRFSNAALHISHLSTSIASADGSIGKDVAGAPLDHLFYQAQRSTRRIGMVTTTSFTHPAAAGFYSHLSPDYDPDNVAPQLFDSTTINLMLGGNPEAFTRNPERNLIQEAQARGYNVIRNPKEIPDIPRWRTRLLLGVFDYPDDLFDPESHATSPSLEEMLILAIQCLQFHIGGYFMVVVHPDPSEINYAGELPEEFHRAHVYQLNAALQSACDYIGDHGTVLLYAPQQDTTGWMIQLKGNARPKGAMTLSELNGYIRQQF